MMSLLERLQRHPSLLNTNSFLSQPLEDLLLSLPDVDEDEEDGEGDYEVSGDNRTRLAKEDVKLERELIRVIQSGKAAEILKPNSGQAVTVGDSHICVGFHEEPHQGYRVWEWHGHVLLYDEVQGYSPEYVYGNYFEKLTAPSKDDRFKEKDNPFSSSGLREIIDGGDALNGRIVRTNLSSGGKREMGCEFWEVGISKTIHLIELKFGVPIIWILEFSHFLKGDAAMMRMTPMNRYQPTCRRCILFAGN